MIFLTAAAEPTVFLMLAEADVRTLRTGRTLYVDRTATGGEKFDKVVVSLHPTNEAALDAVRRSGHPLPANLPSPSPATFAEERCAGCGGIMPAWNLHEGRCVVCWYEEATRLRGLRN